MSGPVSTASANHKEHNEERTFHTATLRVSDRDPPVRSYEIRDACDSHDANAHSFGGIEVSECRMPTIASTLLLCLLGLAASPWPRLHVDIVFEGTPMRPRREAAAMEEVTRIWAAHGVDVRRANPDDAGWDGARRLTVGTRGPSRCRRSQKATGGGRRARVDLVPR